MAVCRSCQARITWAITTTGKRIPLDPDPTPDGNLVAIDIEPNEVRYVSKANPAPAGAPRYVSHFATCPNAKAHRRPR